MDTIFDSAGLLTGKSQNHWAIEKENFMRYHVCVLGWSVRAAISLGGLEGSAEAVTLGYNETW